MNKRHHQAETLISKLLSDHNLRKNAATQSHQLFFGLYFGHYIKYETAQFQKEIFEITEDSTIKMAVIVAFRGSAKSTIVSLSYPIWAILGKQQKKFIVILAQTQNQARQIMANLKQELESNEILRMDLGPFQETNDEWRLQSIVLPKYGARITTASIDQSIRGIRHGNHRPDLIIADDIEDLSSVKTKEGRDKVYDWLTGDILPLGDISTKVVIIGNLLHDDSSLMRLKKSMVENKIRGVFRSYPLINNSNEIAWPAKYPNMEAIETEKQRIGRETAWQREYLLRIISDDDQVVKQEWIQTYAQLPSYYDRMSSHILVGVDLAISERDTADYTAIVPVLIWGRYENMKIYVLPNPINERLSFPDTVEKIKFLYETMSNDIATEIAIEDVGYQAAIIQQLNQVGVPAESFKLGGGDKRARLASITHYIKSGTVMLPKTGAEQLIMQLIGFGSEKHDDLADALVIAVLKATRDNRRLSRAGLGRIDLL